MCMYMVCFSECLYWCVYMCTGVVLVCMMYEVWWNVVLCVHLPLMCACNCVICASLLWPSPLGREWERGCIVILQKGAMSGYYGVPWWESPFSMDQEQTASCLGKWGSLPFPEWKTISSACLLNLSWPGLFDKFHRYAAFWAIQKYFRNLNSGSGIAPYGAFMIACILIVSRWFFQGLLEMLNPGRIVATIRVEGVHDNEVKTYWSVCLWWQECPVVEIAHGWKLANCISLKCQSWQDSCPF